MTLPIEALYWSTPDLHEALTLAVQRAGLDPRPGQASPPPPGADAAAVSGWFERSCDWLGVDVSPFDAHYNDLDKALRTVAPAIAFVGQVNPQGVSQRFLVLLRRVGKSFVVLAPDKRSVRVPVAAVFRVLTAEILARIPPLDVQLDRLEVPAAKRAKVRSKIVGLFIGRRSVGPFWALRRSLTRESLMRRVGRVLLTSRFGLLVTTRLLSNVLVAGAWALIGSGALNGTIDKALIVAWALLLLSNVPLQLWTGWLQGRLATDVGRVLKQQMLLGTFRLDTDALRSSGAGELLGRVFEAGAVESLALGGGFLAVFSVFDLATAALVIASVGAASVLGFLLLVWSVIILVLGVYFHRANVRFAKVRLAMSNDLVERMVGHRTRLAQQEPSAWHEGEDELLDGYLQTARQGDRAVVLLSLAPRGWMLLGFAGLAQLLVKGAPSPAEVAIGLGGILLAQRAFAGVSNGITSLSGAIIATRIVRPLIAPPDVDTRASAVPVSLDLVHSAEGAPIVEGQELMFSYPSRGKPVLRGCNLQIRHGERVLLEGPSGEGKSTLGALIVGLRTPDVGLLLLGGVDRQTMGFDVWRRYVTAAPQFHENHVFCATLAFNLLMGRAWPAEQSDLAEARDICEELGLGPLLDSMPSGLLQTVGDSGWQLSHGEKSRLYIARALLQRAELIVFDESFGALDPETLEKAIRCVMKRAPTLVVIAHP